MTHLDTYLDTDLDTYDETIEDDDPATIAEDARRFPPGHPVHTAHPAHAERHLFVLVPVRENRLPPRRPLHGRSGALPRRLPAAHLRGGRPKAASAWSRQNATGLTFDEALERWPDELASLWAWNNRVENRRGAPRPRERWSVPE